MFGVSPSEYAARFEDSELSALLEEREALLGRIRACADDGVAHLKECLLALDHLLDRKWAQA